MQQGGAAFCMQTVIPRANLQRLKGHMGPCILRQVLDLAARDQGDTSDLGAPCHP